MLNVDGFLFEDEAIAAQARKEEEGIRFIKEKSALNNPETVLKIYQTILQQKLFVTPVGLRFLMELQSFLMASPSIKQEEVPVLNVSDYIKGVEAPKKPTREKHYKSAFHVAAFFAVVFGISVVGMFLIAELSSNNVNIINYREKIIDQYEQWENELELEEKRLEQWEEQLSEREAILSGENTE